MSTKPLRTYEQELPWLSFEMPIGGTLSEGTNDVRRGVNTRLFKFTTGLKQYKVAS